MFPVTRHIEGEAMTDDKQGEGPIADELEHGEETTVIPPLDAFDASVTSDAESSIGTSDTDTSVSTPDDLSGVTSDDAPVAMSDTADAVDDDAVVSEETPRNPLDVPDFNALMAPVDIPRRRPSIVVVAGAVVAALVVIALVVTLVVIRPFGSVRAADYVAGTKQTVAMQRQYDKTSSAIDDALGFLYSQDTAYDAQKVSVLKVQATKLRESAASFVDLKANRDANVSAAYDSYARQADRFAELSTNLAASAEALSTMNDACGDTPSGTVYDSDFTAQYEQYIASCRTATEPLAKAKAKVVSEFSSTLTQSLDQMTAVIDQIKALGAPSSISSGSDRAQQLQTLASQLVDLDASSGAINDFQDKLRQSRENANPSTLLQKLNTALKEGYAEQSK